jgi:hypothetical protein
MIIEQKIEPIEHEEEFEQKTKKIYKSKYQKIFEPDEALKGTIVAIEVDSGDYFMGDIMLQAGFKGREKYPHKEFFFFRFGYKAVCSHKGKIAIFGLKKFSFCVES